MHTSAAVICADFPIFRYFYLIKIQRFSRYIICIKGEYDWSHLAMSMFPARVTQKAKKDWCLALTHGLEHLCENKPKEKKTRKKKADVQSPTLGL